MSLREKIYIENLEDVSIHSYEEDCSIVFTVKAIEYTIIDEGLRYALYSVYKRTFKEFDEFDEDYIEYIGTLNDLPILGSKQDIKTLVIFLTENNAAYGIGDSFVWETLLTTAYLSNEIVITLSSNIERTKFLVKLDVNNPILSDLELDSYYQEFINKNDAFDAFTEKIDLLGEKLLGVDYL